MRWITRLLPFLFLLALAGCTSVATMPAAGDAGAGSVQQAAATSAGPASSGGARGTWGGGPSAPPGAVLHPIGAGESPVGPPGAAGTYARSNGPGVQAGWSTILAGDLPTLSGDVSGAYNATTVGGILGKPVPSLPSSSQCIAYNGTAWFFSQCVPPTVILQPGGTAGGSTYTTWASLYAAVHATGVPARVVVDDSLGAAHVTAGAYNLDGWVIVNGAASANLIIDAGATAAWRNLWITGLTITGNNTAPFNDVSVQSNTYVDGGADIESTTTGPFVQVETGAFAYVASTTSVNFGDGTNVVFNVAAGTGQFELFMQGGAVAANACSNSGSSTFTLDYDSAVFLPGTPLTGVTLFAESQAAGVGYSPATPGNWSPTPSIVSSALDQLAARTATIGGLPHGTADQIVDTNHGATTAEWFTLGGDATFASHNLTVTGLQSHAVSSSAPGTGNALIWNGSAWAPASVSVSGGLSPGSADQLLDTNHSGTSSEWFTLGGDATYASHNLTVAAINGSTVPAGGALTTGNVLQVSGSSALTYGAVNLAGGGGSVTGLLPVANVAPGTSAQVLLSNATPASTWTTLSHDATISATGVVTVTGLQTRSVSATLPSAGNSLIWSGLAWAPSAVAVSGGIAQGSADQLIDTNHAGTQAEWFSVAGDLTYASHSFFAQSLSGASGGGSAITLNTTGLTFASTISAPAFQMAATATLNATAQNLKIAPQQSTNGSSTSGKSGDLLLNVGAPPGTSTTEAFTRFQRNGTDIMWVGGDPNTSGADVGIWFGSTTPTGSNYSFLGNPGGGQVYLNATSFAFIETSGSGVQVNASTAAFEPGAAIGAGSTTLGSTTNPWNATVSKIYDFPTSATVGNIQWSGAATANGQEIDIAGQTAGGTAHNGGPVVVIPGAPTTTGTYGGLVVRTSTSNMVTIGDYAIASGAGANTFGAIWFDTNTPTQTNFGFLGGTANTYLNVPSGGTISLALNGAAATGIDISAANGIEMALANLRFYQGVTSPKLGQITQVNGGGAPQTLTIQAQYQFGTDQGSTSLDTPGSIDLDYGTPTTAGEGAHPGNEANVFVSRNGVKTIALGAEGMGSSYAGMFLAPAGLAANTTSYSVLSDGANLYLNGTSSAVIFAVANSQEAEVTTTALIPVSTSGAYNLGSDGNWYGTTYTQNLFFDFNSNANGVIAWDNSGSNANSTQLLGQRGTTAGGPVYIVAGPSTFSGAGGSLNLYAASGVGSNGAITFGYATTYASANTFNAPSTQNVITASLGTTWSWSQGAAAASTNPTSWVFAPEGPNGASGTAAQNTPGSFIVNVAAPGLVGTAGTEASLTLQRAGTATASIGPYPGAPTAGALWFSTADAGTNASQTNFTLYGDSSQAILNATTSMQFRLGGSTTYGQLTTTGATWMDHTTHIDPGGAGTAWHEYDNSITSTSAGPNTVATVNVSSGQSVVINVMWIALQGTNIEQGQFQVGCLNNLGTLGCGPMTNILAPSGSNICNAGASTLSWSVVNSSGNAAVQETCTSTITSTKIKAWVDAIVN